MPLIEVHALTPETVDVAGLVRELNAAVAETLGCSPDAVWTTWHPLDTAYGVGADVVRGKEARATHPPIVHVYIRRTPEQVEAVCATIARVLGGRLPQADEADVFITTQPVTGTD